MRINNLHQSEGEGDTINEGRMVTSIDLFFSAKDDTLPVFVEIRTVVNGYRTRKCYLLVEPLFNLLV